MWICLSALHSVNGILGTVTNTTMNTHREAKATLGYMKPVSKKNGKKEVDFFSLLTDSEMNDLDLNNSCL